MVARELPEGRIIMMMILLDTDMHLTTLYLSPGQRVVGSSPIHLKTGLYLYSYQS